MKDYLLHMAISVVLATLKEPFQLPAVRPAMLKIFRVLRLVYAGDPDFEAVAAKGFPPGPGA